MIANHGEIKQIFNLLNEQEIPLPTIDICEENNGIIYCYTKTGAIAMMMPKDVWYDILNYKHE